MSTTSLNIRRFTVFFTAALALGAASASAQTAPSGAYLLRVKSDSVNIRLRPDVESQIVHQVATNQVLEAAGQEGDWHRIIPPAGTFGLASSAYITTAGGNTGTVSTSTGNLRVRAGSTYQEVDPLMTEPIALLERGQTVTILGKQGDFYKVAPPAGVYFYVSKDFVEPITVDAARNLSTTSTPPPAPVMNPTQQPANTTTPPANSTTTPIAPTMSGTTSQPGLPPITSATPAADPGLSAPPRRPLDDQSVSRDAEAIPMATSSGELEEAPDTADNTPAQATPANTTDTIPMQPANTTPAVTNPQPQPTQPQPQPRTTPQPVNPRPAPANPQPTPNFSTPAPPPERTPGPSAGIVPPGGASASGSIRSLPNSAPTMNGRPLPPQPQPQPANTNPNPAVVNAPVSNPPSNPPSNTSSGATISSPTNTAQPTNTNIQPYTPTTPAPANPSTSGNVQQGPGAVSYSVPHASPTSGPLNTITRDLMTARGILRPSVRVPIGEHGLRYALFDPYTKRASVYVEFPIALGLNVNDLLDRYAIVEGEAYADSTTRAPIIRVEYITITNTTPGRSRP